MVNALGINAAETRAVSVDPITISKVEAWAFREPIETAVQTSFGIMRDRPAVFVRIEDTDGCFGFGEVFANWPAAGAEHRVNLLARDVVHLVLNQTIEKPEDLGRRLTSALRIQMIQTREYGPFQQVIAGLDIACWDLFSRKAKQPLAQFINPNAPSAVPAYASGIHIKAADEEIAKARQACFNRFKVKIGFDDTPEINDVRRIDDALNMDEALMVDVNQGWIPSQAKEFFHFATDLPLAWIEEPLPADRPAAQWIQLSALSKIPIAGGENIAGYDAFSEALKAGYLNIYQPDVIKWGGITGCAHVARAVLNNAHRYCPHFLGGGIGLEASAQLLSAIGGDGWLEVDVNPNQLRTQFGTDGKLQAGGKYALNNTPGLGIDQLPESIMPFLTAHQSKTLTHGNIK